MSLTGVHTNWENGSYINDRNQFIKQRENDDLANDTNVLEVRPHWDHGNSIAIGYGFDLLVRSNTVINNYLNQLSDTLGLTGTQRLRLSQNDMTLLEEARAERNAGTATESYLRGVASRLALVLPDEPAAAALLIIKMKEYETALNKALGSGHELLQSKEKIAVISLLFTMAESTETAIRDTIPATLEAIRQDNRAEAWYEIRYNSNVNKIHASRRYEESKLFGLYDNGTTAQNISDAESKEVLRMYTRHQIQETDTTKTIQYYETSYPPSSLIDAELLIAKNRLITTFASGATINNVIVGADTGNYLNDSPIDIIAGTDKNDLIFGEGGPDTIIANGGDDVIYGGSGVDNLFGGAGDDTLYGGADPDFLIGGAGNDTLYGGEGLWKKVCRPLCSLSLFLLILFFSVSPAHSDFTNSFVKPDCIPELNYFRFSIFSVTNIKKIYSPFKGDKYVDKYLSDLKKKYNLYAEGPIVFSCKLPSYEIDVKLTYITPRERGQCSARPGAEGEVIINGKRVIQYLLFDNPCFISVYFFEFKNDIVRVCAKDGTDQIRCIDKPIDKMLAPLNINDIHKMFDSESIKK